MLSPLPRQVRETKSLGANPSSSAFPKFRVGRLLHYRFRGLLSVYSRYGLQTRQVAYATLYTGGLGGFVTSTAAPIATGWSDPAGTGREPVRGPAQRDREARWASEGSADVHIGKE